MFAERLEGTEESHHGDWTSNGFQPEGFPRQADLVDQLFNSSEKRLARLLLLLANFGKEGKPEPNQDVVY